ncbi:hypothetical protein, partial [Serratia sp. OLJL1]|uniref:hypothetical protein n=1 Tax=Serratia sp. OLJL1 TaxID=1914914 RepID=UPI001A7E146F
LYMFPLRKNDPKRTAQKKLNKYNSYKEAYQRIFFAVVATAELIMYITVQENVFTSITLLPKASLNI